MKALTLKQPYGTAIIHGGKDIENRTQLWGYRGPLAIHAGQGKVSNWSADSLLRDAVARWRTRLGLGVGEPLPQGMLLGVVDLIDAHRETGGCCAPWGHRSAILNVRGTRKRYDAVHLVLTNPRALAEPIPAKGRLGLWDLDAETERRLLAQVAR